jgi:hypothetical protein
MTFCSQKESGRLGWASPERALKSWISLEDPNCLPLWEASELEDSILPFAAEVWLGLELEGTE